MSKIQGSRFKVLLALFALHLSLSISEVQAQVGEHRSELSVGISAGYMMSSIDFVPVVPQKFNTGKTGGITVRYTSEKYFKSICAIVAELNYAQVGWKENILDMDDNPVINKVTGLAEEYQRDMTYIQLPVFARLGWGRERKGLQFFVQAGPQLGWYLSDKTKMNFDWDQRTPSYSNGTGRMSPIVAQDTMAVKNKLDYGIAAGGGFEVSINHVGHFLVEGRYYFGLGNIFANSKRDYFSRSNFNNITIKMSYLFDIARTKNSKIK